jgi:SAM-dependent methyltransferase
MNSDLLNKIKIIAERMDVVSVYLTGLDDGLDISDYDLILVTSRKLKRRRVKREFENIDKKIDLRLITTVDDFKDKYKYIQGAGMTLICGRELRDSFEDSYKMKLVKMAAMFFKSFLRNYYRHSLSKNINIISLLKDLNDFNYCNKYLDNLPDDILVFIDEINKHRVNYKYVNQVDARIILNKAIDNSWILIKILNERLKREFLIKFPKYLYLNVDPTIIIPSSTEDCKFLNERTIGLFKKSKILYLPLGFQFVFSKDSFVEGYKKNNLKYCSGGVLRFFKKLFKLLIALFYYFKFWVFDVFLFFSHYECYSVKRSIITYSKKDFYLFPSERESLSFCDIDKNSKILDLGCGNGRTTVAMLREGYDVVGIDFEEELISEAKKIDNGLYSDKFIVGSAVNINNIFKDKFDTIIFSYNGLDYIYPLKARKLFLESIYHQLKVGGYFVFSGHNSVCINRKYLLVFFVNFFNIIFNRKYLIVGQSFGKILTYFSSPLKICKELKSIGFGKVVIVPNVRLFFPYRDPFPYYVFKKNEK